MNEWRWDALHERWVLMAPSRSRRPGAFPTVGTSEMTEEGERTCPFCPGHEHATPPELLRYGDADHGWKLRVVPNLYAMVGGNEPGSPHESVDFAPPRFPARGVGEVVIDTPRHRHRPSRFSADEWALLLRALRERVAALRGEGLGFATVFKNHGRSAGASLAHSHAQIIALPEPPPDVVRVLQRASGEACFFCTTEKDETGGPRDIFAAAGWMVWAPWAAAHPFETWFFPRAHRGDFAAFEAQELNELALLIARTVSAMEATIGDVPWNLFGVAVDEGRYPSHFHLSLVPRLTRKAGFELATGTSVNTVLPEDAAERLRRA